MSKAKQQQQQQITWRSQVLELTSKGHNQSDIARILQVDKSVICRDMTALNQQSKQNIQKHIDEKLPNEGSVHLANIIITLCMSTNTLNQFLTCSKLQLTFCGHGK